MDPLVLAATCRRLQAVVGDAAGLTAALTLLGARWVHVRDTFAARGTTRSLGDNCNAAVPDWKQWRVGDYITSEAGIAGQGRSALTSVFASVARV